jgi:hypothetical protein
MKWPIRWDLLYRYRLIEVIAYGGTPGNLMHDKQIKGYGTLALFC